MNRTVKICRNENGSTLIVVLLVIAVFSILGLTLIGVSLAHSQQTNQSTYQVQATNAAEMGLKAYDQKIKGALVTINNNVPNTFDGFKTVLDNTLPNELNSGQSLNSLQNTPNFDVKVNDENATNNEIQLTLESVGTVQGVQRTITQKKTFSFGSSLGNNPVCEPNGYLGVKVPCLDAILYYHGNFNKSDGVQVNGKEKNGNINFSISQNDIPNATEISGNQVISNIVYNTNMIISGNTTLNGNVTFKGNTYITGSLTVNGSATFEGYVFFKGNHDLSPEIGGKILFNRTVFSDGNMSVTADNSLIVFSNGLVTGGNTQLTIVENGKIIIGGQKEIGFPLASDTKYW